MGSVPANSLRVHGEDVGHRHERGEAGGKFRLDGCRVLLQLEEPIEESMHSYEESGHRRGLSPSDFLGLKADLGLRRGSDAAGSFRAAMRHRIESGDLGRPDPAGLDADVAIEPHAAQYDQRQSDNGRQNALKNHLNHLVLSFPFGTQILYQTATNAASPNNQGAKGCHQEYR